MLFKLIRFLAVMTLLPAVSAKDKAIQERISASSGDLSDTLPVMNWWWLQRPDLVSDVCDIPVLDRATDTLRITEEFIKQKVIGSKRNKNIIAAAFSAARSRSEETRAHIDIVFHLMPELRIRPYSAKPINDNQLQLDFSRVPSGGAHLDQHEKMLFVRLDKISPDVLIHEMDHAFRLLAHYILNEHKKASLTVPFFPDTPEESHRYLQIFETSNQQFNCLGGALFKHAARKQRSQEETALIKKLIALGDNIFNDPSYFMNEFDGLQLSDQSILAYAKRGITIAESAIVNLDPYFAKAGKTEYLLGEFKVLSMTPAFEDSTAGQRLKIQFIDPLRGLVKFMSALDILANSHCKLMGICRTLLEKAAIIREHLSSEAIELMFPGLIQYDQALRQKVYKKVAKEKAQDNSLTCSFDDSCKYQRLYADIEKQAIPYSDLNGLITQVTKETIAHLKHPESQQYIGQLDAALAIATIFIRAGKLDEASLLLASLRHYGVKDAIVYAKLGYLSFVQKKYGLAVTEFSTAHEKSGGRMGGSDTFMHGVSFWHTGNTAAAKETLALACSKMKKSPDTLKERQEQCESFLSQVSTSHP